MAAGTQGYYSEHDGLTIDKAVELVERKKRNISNLPEDTVGELKTRIPSVVLTQQEYDAIESPDNILYMILEDE